MKSCLLKLLCALILLTTGLTSANADSIAGLFSTGAGGTNGHADLHYQLIQEPVHAPTTAMIATATPATWLSMSGVSWLGVAGDCSLNEQVGFYTYRLSFDLVNSAKVALDPHTVSLQGEFAADDMCVVLLNGVEVAHTPDISGQWNFAALTAFSINSGFVSGTNTLDFVVQNAGTVSNPTGLLVTDFCSSASVVAVPEPSVVAFWTATLLFCGFMKWTMQRQTPSAAKS